MKKNHFAMFILVIACAMSGVNDADAQQVRVKEDTLVWSKLASFTTPAGETTSLQGLFDSLKDQVPGFDVRLAQGAHPQLLERTRGEFTFPRQSLDSIITSLFRTIPAEAGLSTERSGNTLIIHQGAAARTPHTRSATQRVMITEHVPVPAAAPATYAAATYQHQAGDWIDRDTLDRMHQSIIKFPITYQNPALETPQTLMRSHALNMAYASTYGVYAPTSLQYGEYFSVYPGYWGSIKQARKIRRFQNEEYVAAFRTEGPDGFLNHVNIYVDGFYVDKGNNVNNFWDARIPVESDQPATIAFVTRLEGQFACFSERVNPKSLAVMQAVNDGDVETPKFRVSRDTFYSPNSTRSNKLLRGVWDESNKTCVAATATQ